MTAEAFLLSPGQRRLWPEQNASPALRAQLGVILDGELDRERLGAAAQRLSRRHDLLRTSFERASGARFPLQVLRQGVAATWDECDLGAAAGAEARFSELFEQLAERPFCFTEPAAAGGWILARLGDRCHGLILFLPALCADAGSLRVLLSELFEIYRGGEPRPDDGEVTQFLQVAEWQREMLESTDQEETAARQSWLSRSQTVPPLLPRQRPLVAAEPFSTLTVRQTLNTERARTMSAQQLDKLLLAAWWLVLWRLTGERLRELAVLSDGRSFDDLAGALGPLAKVLPLRLTAEPGWSFEEWAGKVSEELAEARSRQDSYLAPEVARGERPANPWRFESRPWPKFDAGALQIRPWREVTRGERFEFVLVVQRPSAAVDLELEFDRRIFDQHSAQALLDRLVAVFEAGCEDCSQRLGEMVILSATERQQLWIDFQGRPAAAALEPLPLQVARQVAKQPRAEAVVCGDQRWTYGQLGQRVAALAGHLRSLGVRLEDRVAICAERSAEVVAAMLAVWRAGGAYIFLEPGSPPQRLAAALEDSGARVLVSESRWNDTLPSFAGPRLLLDQPLEPLPDGCDEPPRAIPEQLAYVLFTSGSTGRPKGVAVEHRALSNYVAAVRARLEFAEGWRYAMVSTFAADLGHTMLFPALASGGTVHVLSTVLGSNPDALAAYTEAEAIDCLKIVPSHLGALLATSRLGRLLPRRRLVLGGEVCPWPLLRRVAELAPALRLFNHYGPTESTVGVLAGEVGETAAKLPGVPLGQPLDGISVYLLDRRGQPVAEGMTGEVYLAGAGLARGYLGRPGWTAERFVPEPRGGAGGRQYRTGDLARHGRLTDGQLTLEFVGRTDHQVKLRGFRIELGEVEAALLSSPEVRQAVAMVRTDGDGDGRLVAYVVPRDRYRAAVAELRAALGSQLPDALLPSAIVVLESLPLTANGKIDRGALPAPEKARSLAESFVAPRTDVERRLAEIWADVLSLERVGTEDNFFDLGGDSILAIQVIARANRAGLTLDPRQIFQHQKIAELARLEGLESGTLAAIERAPEGAALPLSFAQERLWLAQRLDPASSAYNIPRAVRLGGELRPEVLRQAVTEILRRHHVLRTRFVEVDQRLEQVIEPAAEANMPVIELSALAEADRRRQTELLLDSEARRPFDLESGELLRTSLLRYGDGEHVFSSTLHHIAGDGWSAGILIAELVALYGGLAAGPPAELAELPVRYADFAYWQRQWISGEIFDQQLEFWRQRLAGAPESAGLPTDRRRGEQRSFTAGEVAFEVSAATTEALVDLGRPAAATPFVVLLTAFFTLLHRLSGQTDIVVGTDVANRQRLELEGLIGFFVNNLVLRARIEGNPRFDQFLRQVSERTLDDFAHQDVPFDQLVKALKVDRQAGRTPLFDVLFVYQNLPSQQAGGGGLEIEDLDLEQTKFDLAFFLWRDKEGFRGSWLFRRDVFDESTVARWVRHYQLLLESIVSNPRGRLSQLQLSANKETRGRRRVASGGRLRGARRAVAVGAEGSVENRPAGRNSESSESHE